MSNKYVFRIWDAQFEIWCLQLFQANLMNPRPQLEPRATVRHGSSARCSTLKIGPKIEIGPLLGKEVRHHRADSDLRPNLRLRRSKMGGVLRSSGSGSTRGDSFVVPRCGTPRPVGRFPELWTQRATSRCASCLRSPWGDFLCRWIYPKTTEYLETSQILCFNGFRLRRKSPHGGSQAENMPRASCPEVSTAAMGVADPKPGLRKVCNYTILYYTILYYTILYFTIYYTILYTIAYYTIYIYIYIYVYYTILCYNIFITLPYTLCFLQVPRIEVSQVSSGFNCFFITLQVRFSGFTGFPAEVLWRYKLCFLQVSLVSSDSPRISDVPVYSLHMVRYSYRSCTANLNLWFRRCMHILCKVLRVQREFKRDRRVYRESSTNCYKLVYCTLAVTGFLCL